MHETWGFVATNPKKTKGFVKKHGQGRKDNREKIRKY